MNLIRQALPRSGKHAHFSIEDSRRCPCSACSVRRRTLSPRWAAGRSMPVGRTVFGDVPWPFLKAVFEGFTGGLQADVASGRADAAKEHLLKIFVPWNAAKFYGGYVLGLGIGLVSPITDLVKGILGAVKLAVSAVEWSAKWSPAGIAISPERQQKIVQLTEKFSRLATEWGNAVDGFLSNPKKTIEGVAGFLENLMQQAQGQARDIGARAAHSIFQFLESDFFDMGKGIGEAIGTIAQVLLVVFSEGIGNLLAEGAGLLGKAAGFAAGEAAEALAWVKGFASKIITLIRSALRGALKLFEGLAESAIEAFDALKAFFVETEALDLGAKRQWLVPEEELLGRRFRMSWNPEWSLQRALRRRKWRTLRRRRCILPTLNPARLLAQVG